APIGFGLEDGRELRHLFDDALNFAQPRAGMSRRISRIHPTSGRFAKCSDALKFTPQACPSAADRDIFSAPAASVILFCTVPAGAYGACQVPMPRGDRSTCPHNERSLALVFP